VAALKTIVDSKVSVTSVGKVVNDANQALATVEGRVTSAYSKAIEEIEGGGRNLISDSNDTVIEFKVPNPNSTRAMYFTLTSPVLAVGESYILSYWAKSENVTPYYIWLYFNDYERDRSPAQLTSEWRRYTHKIVPKSEG